MLQLGEFCTGEASLLALLCTSSANSFIAVSEQCIRTDTSDPVAPTRESPFQQPQGSVVQINNINQLCRGLSHSWQLGSGLTFEAGSSLSCGLILAGSHTFHSSSTTDQKQEIRRKISWADIKTGTSLENYHQRQSRLYLRKKNLIYCKIK